MGALEERRLRKEGRIKERGGKRGEDERKGWRGRGSHLMIERVTGMFGSEMVQGKETRKNDW